MKITFFIVLVSFFLVVAGCRKGCATEVVVQLEDLDQMSVSKVLEAQKKLQESKAPNMVTTAFDKVTSVSPESVDRWVEVFAKAFNEFCKSINVQANELLKSPAGFALVMLLAMNFGGGTLLLKLLAYPVALFLWTTCIVLVWKFMIRVLKKEYTVFKYGKDEHGKKTVTEETKYSAIFNADGVGLSAIFSAVFIIIITWVLAGNLF